MKISLSIIVLSCVTVCSAQAAELYSENFESYNPGGINGQSSWSAGANDPQIVTGVGSDTTKVVSNTESGTDGVATKTVRLSWGTNTKGSFSFDTCFAGKTSNVAYVGIGASGNAAVGFMVGGALISFRPGGAAGTLTPMTDVGGKAMQLTAGKWYKITANFTRADNTITDVWLTNLTDGDSAVQMYFGVNTATRAYVEAGDESTWTKVILRLPASTGSVRMIDNISLSGYEEMVVGGVSIGRDMLWACSSSSQGTF
jgi:hypothetical protein